MLRCFDAKATGLDGVMGVERILDFVCPGFDAAQARSPQAGLTGTMITPRSRRRSRYHSRSRSALRPIVTALLFAIALLLKLIR